MARRRNGAVLVAAWVASAVLTRVTFQRPGVGPALLLAAVLVAGALLSGGVPVAHRRGKHPLVRPVLTALAVFVVFVVVGWFARLLPPVDHAVDSVLRRADAWSWPAAALLAAVAGVAEEVFYRGAVFERARLPLVTATAAHALATLPALNVALTGAALLLGVVLGLSRRASGGWWAPAVTHTAWSLLVLAWLPR
ncbi:MAG TPA: CPBP family glutamic-type intramembrane protease [Mycobacteriales bacterium]|jgi:hypothetical protein|nr:CPBP family glutamic-type intramembrane protease [Mycobacteriales bacterium]